MMAPSPTWFGIRPLTAVFALWLTTTAWSQMTVDGPGLELHPAPEDTTALSTFSFENTSDRAVRIMKVDSSCSCLKAELDKEVYAPGERGVGTAEFKVSTFVGRQEKTVHVATDHPSQPEWVIPFVLVVPVEIELEPRTLQWWVGEDSGTQVCTVRMVGEKPLHITNVTSTRESVSFEWKEIEKGRVYEIHVTPVATDKVLLGALKIETDSEIPMYQRQLAFFSIYRRPKPPSPESEGPSS